MLCVVRGDPDDLCVTVVVSVKPPQKQIFGSSKINKKKGLIQGDFIEFYRVTLTQFFMHALFLTPQSKSQDPSCGCSAVLQYKYY